MSWNEPLSRLAWLAAKRPVSLALAAACLLVDRAIRWHGMGFALRAVIDEPCHVATAIVVLGAITRFRGTPPNPMFIMSMLACSVLIDVDHLPQEFGSSVMTAGTPRPYTHALWLLAMLIAAAVAARHRSRNTVLPPLVTGAAWGVGAHFLRDVATAPMSLWWPVSDAAVQVPYWWYVLAFALIIVIPPPRRSWMSDPPGPPDERQESGYAASAEARNRAALAAKAPGEAGRDYQVIR